MAGAREAGYAIEPGHRLPWLTVFGHLEPSIPGCVAGDVIERLGDIFTALGGREIRLSAKRGGASPRPDGLWAGRIVEVDEIQHFTSARLRTLEMYPRDAALGYDLDEYRALCRRWSATADRYRSAK